MLFRSVLFLLTGCKKNVGTPEDNAVTDENDDKKEDTDQEKKVFGFCGIDMSNPFYATLKDSVQSALEAQGDKLLIKDPAGDAERQNTQIQELIEEDVDAVFLCPVDWKKIEPALDALEEAEIPVINLDTEVYESGKVAAYVGSDNRNAGYVCGEDLVARKPDGGQVVIVENLNVNSVCERITGFEEAVSKGAFVVVKRIQTGNDVSGLKQQVTQVLAQNPDLDAIMCGDDQMAEMVEALSDNFKLALNNGNKYIKVADSVKWMQGYMKLQNMRYNNRFELFVDISREILQRETITFIFQPFIENAMYHGLEPKIGKGKISLRGWQEQNDMIFTIEDDGVGIDDMSRLENGYGVRNVIERIKLNYGEKYGVTFESSPGKGTKVTIVVPVR